MPWPRPQDFGIVDNPLIDSPFVGTVKLGGSAPPTQDVLLLSDGSTFLLSDGTAFLIVS